MSTLEVTKPRVTTLLEKIRSRSHWEVVIRPTHFDAKRISDFSMLYPLVEKHAIRLRGWDYPHIDARTKPDIGLDWVGQGFEWQQFLEFWRFYQSGQFVHIFGLDEDWRDQSQIWPSETDWRGARLEVGNALFQYTEIYEFAARLASTDAGDDVMHIDITLHGLQGRALWFQKRRILPSIRQYVADINEFPYSIDVSRVQLIAEPRDLALKTARELFMRFDWKPPLDLLRDLQEELL